MNQDINKEVKRYIEENFQFSSYFFWPNDSTTRNTIASDLAHLLENHLDIDNVSIYDITTGNDTNNGIVKFAISGFYGRYHKFEVFITIGE